MIKWTQYRSHKNNTLIPDTNIGRQQSEDRERKENWGNRAKLFHVVHVQYVPQKSKG